MTQRGGDESNAAEPAIEVREAPDEHIFEILLDGDRIGLTGYRLEGDRVAFTHTEVDEQFEGKGYAGRLVSAALDDMRERRRAVLPYCPYVRRYIERHPEYLDLVPLDARAEFDLPTC
jgi:uncharacterized protein